MSGPALMLAIHVLTSGTMCDADPSLIGQRAIVGQAGSGFMCTQRDKNCVPQVVPCNAQELANLAQVGQWEIPPARGPIITARPRKPARVPVRK